MPIDYKFIIEIKLNIFVQLAFTPLDVATKRILPYLVRYMPVQP